MITIDGLQKTIQHFPFDFSLHGKNPYGESLYRVVWSDSRTYLVGKRSTNEWKQLPLYPGKHCWMLEKWLSPEKFAGSRMAWEFQELDGEAMLGPYPDRGEYQGCQELPPDITSSAVSRIIGMIEEGRKFTYREKLSALRAEREQKDAQHLDRAMDIWKNAQGAFNNKPSNVHPGKRTAEDVVFKKSAEELGLPVGDGKFFQGK